MSPHLVVWHRPTRSNYVGFNFQVALDPEEEDEKQEKKEEEEEEQDASFQLSYTVS